ncbi:MAG: PEP-CTERM sorting domain-containing protein, partial [Chthoniobacterales bacterium]
TAGTKDGTATISLVSNGTGTSGLTNTNLSSQTVNVTGQVNFFADPLIIFKNGAATLTMNSPTSFTLNFGVVAQNSGSYLASFGVQNSLHDATFQDSLGGTFNIASVTNFGVTGTGPFSNIIPGSSLDPNVTFDSSQALGTYSNTLTLSPTSSNASGTSNLNDVTLTLQGQIIIVPEPSTWAMLLGGGGMLIVLRRFLRRRD